MTTYTLIEAVSDGILRLDSKYGPQVWTRIKRVRVARLCATGCQRPIEKGHTAYSPLTNGDNRSHRICLPCSWRLRDEGRDAQLKARHSAAR